MSWFKGATTPFGSAARAVTPAARLFGIINEEPTKENKDAINEAINKAIDQDKREITPEAIEQAEKAEDGSSLTKNEDNAILEVEKYKKQLLEQELRQAFIADQQNITKFREECVEEAIKQFQKALVDYDMRVAPSIQVSPKISRDIMKKIAKSWSELLISTTQGDSSVYLSYKTFFFRVNQAIDALLTQCIFLSTKWGVMQTALSVTHPPPDFKSYPTYPKVQVGPCWYVVGPILDFKNIEGRIFIYVKCYRTEQCTDGIYFWVYGSQSEGFNRVFFKLDPFGAIEKGFDYTQGTFVHLRLQMALCSYYETYRRETPKLLDTLTVLNSFMMNMPYLQQHATYNSLHLYKIDDMFASIIKRGFPLHSPLTSSNTMNNDWSSIINMRCKKRGLTVSHDNQLVIARELQPEWEVQHTFFPLTASEINHPFYDFSRIKMGYGTTCPYIFCFTTCGLIQSCPMFKLFLSANSYKTTFWCQGFQNYTKMLSVDPNHEILSPVLHVVMGALLQKPDMAMSSLRNIMLNIGIMSDARLTTQQYNGATKAIMTLGTGKLHKEPDSTTEMPLIDTIRNAAYRAYEKIQRLSPDRSSGDPFRKSSTKQVKTDASLDAIIKQKVTKKIIMIECLANFYIQQPRDSSNLFVAEVNRLLDFHPDHKLTLLQRINFAAKNTQVPEHALAYAFIVASPEAAAAALFGYISSPKKLENEPTEFEKELTDLAHLCFKKEWSDRMIDNEYNASPGVFNDANAIHNYLGEDGVFHEFVPDAPPAHPAPPAPYVFISSFDEVRKVDTSPTNPNPIELDVTVVTFAHIYRVDCGYHEVFADDSDVLKSMSILYQISTTIVYKRENPGTPSKILYAITQRTPLLCLPDLPDAIKYLIAKKIKALIEELTGSHMVSKKVRQFLLGTDQIIFNNKSHLATFLENITEILLPPKKILPPSKLSENEKILLPQIQQLLDQLIQLLQQEAAAAAAAAELLTTPYTLCATYKRVASYGAFYAGKMMEYFFGGENGYYQLPYFFRNFDKFLKVCHQYDSTALMYLPNVPPYNLLHPLPNAQPLLDASIQLYFTGLDITFTGDSIGTKLEKNTKDVHVIFEYLTKDFMIDTNILDDTVSSQDTLGSSQGLTSSTGSTGSTSSDDQSGNESSQDSSWSPGSQSLGSSQATGTDSLQGGTLPIKNHIKKSITTRKKKNKNKSRTKSTIPIRRVTIRIKRMMESKGSKVTKPRTYKRRATGGNRKSKPNKTMRRYRRVRK